MKIRNLSDRHANINQFKIHINCQNPSPFTDYGVENADHKMKETNHQRSHKTEARAHNKKVEIHVRTVAFYCI